MKYAETRTYSAQIIEGIELRRQATVYAQELLVHHRGEREGTERLHARVVDPL